jgi:hypothetical protein
MGLQGNLPAGMLLDIIGDRTNKLPVAAPLGLKIQQGAVPHPASSLLGPLKISMIKYDDLQLIGSPVKDILRGVLTLG